MQFDGLNLDDNFTLELWTTGEQNNFTESPALISIGNQESTQFALYRHPNIKSQIMVDLDNEMSYNTVSSLDTVNSKNFNFIAIIKSENTLSIYFNGVNIEYDFQNWDSSLSLYIGAVPFINISNFWIGTIDEIRLWDTALTDEQLQFHFENPDKLFESNDEDEVNLTSLWRLEYTEPSNIVEDSKDNKDGVIYTLPGYSVELSTKSAQ